jgi:hypothetical protein
MRRVLVVVPILVMTLMLETRVDAAEYAFRDSYTCVSTSGGFGPNFQLTDQGSIGHGSSAGISNVNPDGTGTSTGMALNVFPGSTSEGSQPGGSGVSNCSFTTTNNPDGSFTQNVSCDSTTLIGSGVGTPFASLTQNGIQIVGRTDPTGRTTVYGTVTPTVETLTFCPTPPCTTGIVVKQVCSRSGVAVFLK